MKSGTVKFFNSDKGFGFIKQDNGPDVFVHANDLQGVKIKEGDKVTFDTVTGKKGDNAVDVELV